LAAGHTAANYNFADSFLALTKVWPKWQVHLGHMLAVLVVKLMHGVEPKTVTCPAINGIIKEADEIAGEVDNKEVLDAALITAAQAVEHYEITRYGALVAWAKQLGRSDCASVLHQNLEEEKAADQKLTRIAESKVNLEAAQ
jgi:ferritin-like metal-binding protein YciE